MMCRIRLSLLLVATLACPLTGCASRAGPTEWRVPSGGYAVHFDAAREAVRDVGFELARVDARAGVLLTAPASSSGFATPWLAHARSDPSEAIESFLHRERRQVRITFAPSGTDAPNDDLRVFDGEIVARVEVSVDRLYREGRQVDSTSIRETSFYWDPRLARDLDTRPVVESVRSDDTLAAAIVRRIEGLVSGD